MTVTVYGAPVTITAATIQLTRQWFADNAVDCIQGATAGEFYVNDLARYVAWQAARAASSLAGEWDWTLTFVQRAIWIQTGQSVPLLN